MTAESLKDAIRRELPEILRADPGFREELLELTRQHHPLRAETHKSIVAVLAELRHDREANERKWEAQQVQAERARAEQAAKWEENNRHFDRVHEEIMAQTKTFDRGIGALGARWGIQSERAFRNALAGILEESFGVEVININEFDHEGTVFGRPEQIELANDRRARARKVAEKLGIELYHDSTDVTSLDAT